MKRPIFLIIGTVFIFILVGVWIYVLLYGNPENLRDTFTDFNLEDTTDTTEIIDTTPVETEPVVDVTSDEKLRQLTTKPVVGYQLVQKTPSSTPEIYYIEAGTGHIFSINRASGEERRISKTTIPNANNGVITANGQTVMITSGVGQGSETFVGRLSTTSDTLITTNLGEQATNIAVSTENTILYSVQTANTLVVKEYLPITNSITTLFTIPFREAVIDWGNTAVDTHYVYPKATNELEGYVYQVTNATLGRLPISGFGLSAIGNDDYILFSKKEGEEYNSYSYTKETGEITRLPMQILPEKCISGNIISPLFICSVTVENIISKLPNDWHQGKVSDPDGLWVVDTSSNSVTFEFDTRNTGRELNFTNVFVSEGEKILLLQNRNDKTLWLYSV